MQDEQHLTSKIPYENGEELIAKAKARKTLKEVDQRSPIDIFGKELLTSIASRLDSKNQTDRNITACRLALKLRKTSGFMQDLVRATTRTDADFPIETDSVDSGFEARSGRSIAQQKREAKQKIQQAKTSLEKLIGLLGSKEVARFGTFDTEQSKALRAELERLEDCIETPIGLRRGHSVLSECIGTIHRVFFDLTGTWLRDSRDTERQDEFVTHLLFEMTRRIAPESFVDEVIWSTIETKIKKRKSK